MRLVIAEKTDAAHQIANLLSDTKVRGDKVNNATVYRFTANGEEWVSLGTMGHILEMDYPGDLAKDNRWSFNKLPELVQADLVFAEDPQKAHNTIAAIKSLFKIKE